MGEYTREEWLQRRGNGGNLGKFYKSRERMIHKSAIIVQEPNPLFNPELPVSGINQPTFPKVRTFGRASVYNIGRNASKRKDRNADIRQRKLSRKVGATT